MDEHLTLARQRQAAEGADDVVVVDEPHRVAAVG
jgi:hypothetical protein